MSDRSRYEAQRRAGATCDPGGHPCGARAIVFLDGHPLCEAHPERVIAWAQAKRSAREAQTKREGVLADVQAHARDVTARRCRPPSGARCALPLELVVGGRPYCAVHSLAAVQERARLRAGAPEGIGGRRSTEWVIPRRPDGPASGAVA